MPKQQTKPHWAKFTSDSEKPFVYDFDTLAELEAFIEGVMAGFGVAESFGITDSRDPKAIWGCGKAPERDPEDDKPDVHGQMGQGIQYDASGEPYWES